VTFNQQFPFQRLSESYEVPEIDKDDYVLFNKEAEWVASHSNLAFENWRMQSMGNNAGMSRPEGSLTSRYSLPFITNSVAHGVLCLWSE
jgi:hypothetical protein